MRTPLGDQSLILSSSSRGSRGGYDWNAWNLWGRRRMIRCTQHFKHIGLTWLTQWSNLTSLWYGQFSLSLGKALTFPLHSYTLKWGPVRAGAQLVRVNSDKRHSLETATLEQKWRQTTQTRWVETVTAIWLPPQYVKQLLVLKFRLGTYVTLLKPWLGLLNVM